MNKDTETNNAETNDSETNNTETNNTEINNTETNNTETNNDETNNAETNNAETNEIIDIDIEISKQFIDTKLFFIDNQNIFKDNYFSINSKYMNYMEVLSEKLDKRKFFGYFNKTLTFYPIFKLGNFKEAPDYFRRCQLLAILEQMSYIIGSLSEFSNIQNLIKIGPSKNNKKNCCLIDDSTILDETDNSIRNTLGDINEPHRGYKMFNELDYHKKNGVIDTFYMSFIQLRIILNKIKNRKYLLFDPIEMLQRIVKFCANNKLFNLINLLASEINDKSFKLKIEEKIKLFHNYDDLKKLWKEDFITYNHGKFRIFILGMYFIDLVNKNQLNEF